ncbi:MAG: DNA-binding transcriptional regulator [Kiritimatiellae bacterium]|nr:DNA-binding transcriptional regulator [Kiritimatiellia bacterium]
MKKAMRIAVQIETNRAHGRALLEGIADYALARTDWRLEAVEPNALTNPHSLRRFDGFIVRVMDDRTADALIRTRKPVIDTYGRNDRGSIPFIRLDDGAIARCAADCFAEHRYTRCAFCGFKGLRFSEVRGEEFRKAVTAIGGNCAMYDGGGSRLKETFVRKERMDETSDALALRRWLRALPKPVAVFCCNDIRAFQLLKACADVGIAVPHDVAVLGVDNDKVLCTFTNPPLSSIDTNPFVLGQTAAQMLDGLLGSPKKMPPAATLHKPRCVVERTSTEFYPMKTQWLSDALVFIRRHLGDGISANDVIVRLGYSHTTVGKAFHAELGLSVQQEIIRQRRERACRLLKETSRTAADIAAECGYPSAQYFAHMFTEHFGITPDAWRKG